MSTRKQPKALRSSIKKSSIKKVDSEPPGLFKESDVREFREIFKMFDKDGDGSITSKDLAIVLSEGGQHVTNRELHYMCNVADIDRDGAVNFQEFMEMIRQGLDLKDTEREVIQAFKVFDREGNGFINSQEMRRIMTNLGAKLNDEEVDAMVREADLDGDGQINYEEFTKIMMVHQGKR